jgi:hypothetical protein
MTGANGQIAGANGQIAGANGQITGPIEERFGHRKKVVFQRQGSSVGGPIDQTPSKSIQQIVATRLLYCLQYPVHLSSSATNRS